MEAEAVLSVLARIEQGTAIGVYSPIHAVEIGNIPDPERRYLVELLASVLTDKVSETEAIATRAAELEGWGFHIEDARHLAFAEAANCDSFLTTDDRLESNAKRHAAEIRVHVVNPTTFVMEEQEL